MLYKLKNCSTKTIWQFKTVNGILYFLLMFWKITLNLSSVYDVVDVVFDHHDSAGVLILTWYHTSTTYGNSLQTFQFRLKKKKDPMHYIAFSLHEKCPNSGFFLVHIFLYLDTFHAVFVIIGGMGSSGSHRKTTSQSFGTISASIWTFFYIIKIS